MSFVSLGTMVSKPTRNSNILCFSYQRSIF
jgi:hypothetical protein